MAKLNEVINGTDLFVFLTGTSIAHATSHTLSMKMATRNTSNKDSGLWEQKAPGRMDVTASCDGLMVYGATEFERLSGALTNRIPVALKFGQKVLTGSTIDTTYWYASGDFIVTGFDMTAGDAENATFSCSFEHYSGFTLTNTTSVV
jgi:predicted secreted protein